MNDDYIRGYEAGLAGSLSWSYVMSSSNEDFKKGYKDGSEQREKDGKSS